MAEEKKPIIGSYLVRINLRSDGDLKAPTLDEIKATVSVAIAETIDAAAVVSVEAERIDR